MSGAASRDSPGNIPADGPGEIADELLRLRRLLLEPEQARLDALDRRLRALAHTMDVPGMSGTLPAAVRHSTARGKELQDALTPTIEEALAISVRRNPRPLASALFPIIGPAIRAAVGSALRGLIRSLNQTLDQTLTLRGLRWRVEAWRTGVPFGQVVLAHTLLYRIEQAYLIHAPTGLLLAHVNDGDEEAPEGELVSSMLTAIRDFVQDSFGGATEDTLETFRVGEREVFVASGPLANLAAVVHGEAPAGLESRLRETLELVHGEHGPLLEAFEGDTSPLEVCRPPLEAICETRYAEPRSNPGTWLVLALPFLIFGVLLFLYWREGAARERLLDRLAAEPGIAAVTSRSALRAWTVSGLRDPLAADPEAIYQEFERPPRLPRWDFEPYQAAHPAFVLERAQQVLRVPPTVELELDQGRLVGSGEASQAWIDGAQLLGPALTGIERIDLSAVLSLPVADQIRRRIEDRAIHFAISSAKLTADQEQNLDAIAADLRGWLGIPEIATAGPRILVFGLTDPSGDPQSNLVLSERRAEAVSLALSERGVAAELIEQWGGREARAAPLEAARAIASGRRVFVRLETRGGSGVEGEIP